MFTIPASLIPLALTVAGVALVAIAAIYRPLLLSSLSADLAQAQGARVRRMGLVHALALALAVSLAAMTVGAILSTALLIGPAAAALRFADRPGRALGWAVAIGWAATWGGILLAYDSFYWTPGHGWPVSFFIVVLIFIGYLLAGLAGRRPARQGLERPA
jgi:zinc/manganese transport system permease protein